MKLRLTACIYAVLMLALAGFASTALAGGGHGSGQGNGGGQSQSHDQHQQSQHNQQPSGGSGDNSTGVKPSNTTSHDTKAPASSDRTKKYGNGKTAGQIATQAGYGNDDLHGPGNSQPHKVNCGGRHEVDVHALKHKTCGGVEGATHQEQSHKVTICHATGSATNPYVQITVDSHALKNGHTAAKGDIIPAPASGCPKGNVESAATTTQAQEQSCAETKVVETTVIVGVKHFIGPKGSGRYVIIHPSSHSSHYRDKHPDELITKTESNTVTVAAPCPSTTTTQAVTTTQQVTTTEQSTTTTTVAAAVAAAPAAPAAPAPAPTAAGGVLGATAPLHTVKPKASGGVLGSTVRLGRKVSGSNLPFTGLPLWIFTAVALGLILVGAFARRASAER